MNSIEYDALKRLKIPIVKWGDNFRVKVKKPYSRKTFVSKVSLQKNIELISKTYKISEKRLKREFAYEYKPDRRYKFTQQSVLESHEFGGFSQDELYQKVKDFLEGQTKAVKVNIQLGYKLIDRTNGLERDYYPSSNTAIWDLPIAINSKADVEKKIMSHMKATDFTERISYPVSAYQLKEINSANIVIYYRNHILGDSEVKIPEYIPKSNFIINFPKTKNKCMFYCIAYHLIDGEKPRSNKMVSHAKQRVKQYCEFKNIEYSAKVFKDFAAIDIMQFDQLEDCFNLKIDVYEIDPDTRERSKIRSSEKGYDNTISILDYNGHAMYIKDLDVILNKHPCNVCESVFDTSKKLRDHKKMKCAFEYIESFSKKPRRYEPSKNRMQTLLSKYKVYDIDHYIDHFIVYDFEAILFDIDQSSESVESKTRFTNRHQAVSVSVCDSLTNQVRCFVNENPSTLLEEMFRYIHEVSAKIRAYNLAKFKKLSTRIDLKLSNLLEANSKIMDEFTPAELAKNKKLKENNKVKAFFNQKKIIEKERDLLEDLCAQAPLIGFNSGRYDLNLVKKDLFGVLGADNIKMVIKNPAYMCISTNDLKILDISNYLPPATTLEKYLQTYLGKCQCEDKIRCLCGVSKELFCYEYITSFDKLNETALPPKQAFDSKLKGIKASDDDYERLKFVWDHYKMKTIKDLLVWYNNQDVKPFVDAVKKQREFYKTFNLDMLMDGVSLPSLAEKVMYQTCYDDLDNQAVKVRFGPKFTSILSQVNASIELIVNKLSQDRKHQEWEPRLDDSAFTYAYIKVRKYSKCFMFAFKHKAVAKFVCEKLIAAYPKVKFELDLSKYDAPFSFSKKRLDGYKQQDRKSGREFGLTIEHLDLLLNEVRFECELCNCQLTEENVSADRIDNSIGHVDGNVMITCYQCNVARKDMNIRAFQRQKLLEKHSDKLVWSIDEEQKDIYHKMKANIAGGPSIIFNRFAKRNETYIRNGDKLCKKVIGYDANALYLWALGNEMPCGRLTTIEAYDGIVKDIQTDKLFGFLECDIETPEHLKDHFSEMCPIFKNIEIDSSQESIIGEHMFNYGMENGRKQTKSRKLIGSYFGEKVLIYAPLLKWYLSHGLVITKSYSFIKASSHRPFKKFMDKVSDARREGDKDDSKAMIAEMMKLIGNSAFGRSGMDKTKHKEVKYLDDAKSVRSIVEKQNFHDVEELNGSFEVSLKKRRIKFDNPIHLSIAIYQLAKLRMLEFYYDCIDFYMDRSDFQYQEMDTDSAYIAFSDDKPFENLIRPEMVKHFKKHKYDWFPRDQNEEVAMYDRRTAGLFKEEWRGDAMVSLSSKNYHCYLPEGTNKVKTSAKGVQQANGRNADILNQDGFERVIQKQICLSATNRGFRIDKRTKGIITYEQHKTGLNYYYDKRRVLADGITTEPLCI